MTRFDIRCFRYYIQGFNADDCDYIALVLMDTCTKTSRLSSQGQAVSGRVVGTVDHWQLVLVAIVVIRWSQNLKIFFIMLEVLRTSGELL